MFDLFYMGGSYILILHVWDFKRQWWSILQRETFEGFIGVTVWRNEAFVVYFSIRRAVRKNCIWIVWKWEENLCGVIAFYPAHSCAPFIMSRWFLSKIWLRKQINITSVRPIWRKYLHHKDFVQISERYCIVYNFSFVNIHKQQYK
jgi:hypothetical protein